MDHSTLDALACHIASLHALIIRHEVEEMTNETYGDPMVLNRLAPRWQTRVTALGSPPPKTSFG